MSTNKYRPSQELKVASMGDIPSAFTRMRENVRYQGGLIPPRYVEIDYRHRCQSRIQSVDMKSLDANNTNNTNLLSDGPE